MALGRKYLKASVLKKGTYLCLVSLATLWTGIWPLIRVHPPMSLHVRDGLIELPTLTTTEAPLIDMHFLVLFQQVAFHELFTTLLTFKHFVT